MVEALFSVRENVLWNVRNIQGKSSVHRSLSFEVDLFGGVSEAGDAVDLNNGKAGGVAIERSCLVDAGQLPLVRVGGGQRNKRSFFGRLVSGGKGRSEHLHRYQKVLARKLTASRRGSGSNFVRFVASVASDGGIVGVLLDREESGTALWSAERQEGRPSYGDDTGPVFAAWQGRSDGCDNIVRIPLGE